MTRNIVLTLTLAAITTMASVSFAAEEPATKKPAAKESAAKKPSEAEIERTRKVVRMLDDIYKNTIVLITDKYVHDEEDYPAGSAAVRLFEAISKSKSGNHQVRLIDATGDPYEAENVAKDAFEKEGIKRLKDGAAFYEEVVQKDGKYQLRAMTPVPVVMKKCIMCHAHYADAKEGEPIGAISYIVPIE